MTVPPTNSNNNINNNYSLSNDNDDNHDNNNNNNHHVRVSFQEARDRFEKIVVPPDPNNVAATSSSLMLKKKDDDDHPTSEVVAEESSSGRETNVRDSRKTTNTTIDFLQDNVRDMTISRRIAVYLMKRYRWYNPRLVLEDEKEETTIADANNNNNSNMTNPTATKETITSTSASIMENYPYSCSARENPSIAKAWAFFEHVTLPRFLIEPKDSHGKKKNIIVRCGRKLFCKANKRLSKAEPGENKFPTQLYQPIFTPHKQLGDFGLGIGLYFSTLRAITILTLLAGILNAPNLQYFSSLVYSNNQASMKAALLKGSAVCTVTNWVPCPNCSQHKFPTYRLANATDAVNNTLTFALKNDCDGATLEQGMVNYGTLFLIILGVFALNLYLKRMEVAFDEDEQTAQDYSIVINNPPGDAVDPLEWKEFFFNNFEGAHTTAITIAVDNDLLVKALVERREALRKIEMMIEPGTRMDTLTLARIAAKEDRDRKWYHRLLVKLGLSTGVPELFARLVVLTANIQGLAQQDYPATNVFCTFETEAAQRRVLQALSVGSMHIMRNNIAILAHPNHAFRGQVVLNVSEPEEPSTIRWKDLNEKFKERVKQQSLTLLATFVAIVVIAVIVAVLNDKNVLWTGIAISIFNTAFPMFAKWLNSFEAHASEGDKQRSLYTKIAFFRWVNTAIVITITTPFTSVLRVSGGVIPKVYALFFADIVTTNAIQLADPVGHIQKHLLAPRAATQDDMNIKFRGTDFELAERYTNMTKILFLCLWYCAIYPGAFFMCAFALFINYFVDRFSLMRTWSRQPQLGTPISEVSRKYFFSLAILAMAIISSYFWASFPFDNLCQLPSTGSDIYSGRLWNISGSDTGFHSIYVSSNEPLYQYCLQDFFHYPASVRSFPFVPANQPIGLEWMTPEQETVSNIYGITSLVVLALVILSFIWSIFQGFMGMFQSSYSPCGADQGINFSDVPSISSYVPQVESQIFSYPLLACSVDKIDVELLEWTDPDRPHSFYDLTKDAEFLLRGTDVSSIQVFSQIYHYPPVKSASN